ncbi:hypothetical protein RFI_03258 [Reticulomyxa filosa]|uniref:Uncharacterized protein n=1 Tax=Reticulomyxa filosa TaxID=46433 RepID=X6P6V1_RETFI|nr:hypothetical protein RFI_03258 [Reticulomyxa filosa]|eukprot:ETO33843.1 hypothetical protein RFI_03258 [Reticulomyxa filosa]
MRISLLFIVILRLTFVWSSLFLLLLVEFAFFSVIAFDLQKFDKPRSGYKHDPFTILSQVVITSSAKQISNLRNNLKIKITNGYYFGRYCAVLESVPLFIPAVFHCQTKCMKQIKTSTCKQSLLHLKQLGFDVKTSCTFNRTLQDVVVRLAIINLILSSSHISDTKKNCTRFCAESYLKEKTYHACAENQSECGHTKVAALSWQELSFAHFWPFHTDDAITTLYKMLKTWYLNLIQETKEFCFIV